MRNSRKALPFTNTANLYGTRKPLSRRGGRKKGGDLFFWKKLKERFGVIEGRVTTTQMPHCNQCEYTFSGRECRSCFANKRLTCPLEEAIGFCEEYGHACPACSTRDCRATEGADLPLALSKKKLVEEIQERECTRLLQQFANEDRMFVWRQKEEHIMVIEDTEGVTTQTKGQLHPYDKGMGHLEKYVHWTYYEHGRRIRIRLMLDKCPPSSDFDHCRWERNEVFKEFRHYELSIERCLVQDDWVEEEMG